MKISNDVSQNFNGIKIQTSKMTQAQKDFSNNVADVLSYTDVYQRAGESGIDVCFMPSPKKKDLVRVRFIDSFSDNFYRRKDKKIVETWAVDSTNKFNFSDKVANLLNKVINGKFDSPEFDIDKIFQGQTDAAKMNNGVNKNKVYAIRSIERNASLNEIDNFNSFYEDNTISIEDVL